MEAGKPQTVITVKGGIILANGTLNEQESVTTYAATPAKDLRMAAESSSVGEAKSGVKTKDYLKVRPGNNTRAFWKN